MTQKKKPQGTRAVTPHDYELLASFRYALTRFMAFSEDAAKKAGLAPRQHQALLAVKGYPGGADVTVGDLAMRLGIRHHSAVGLINRLAGAGYLTRSHDTADKRRILLSLTPQGEEVLHALSAAHRDELGRMAPLLKRILTRLDSKAPGA